MARSVWYVSALTALAGWAGAVCVPDTPEALHVDPQVVNHPAVLKAFDKVGKILQEPYDANSTRDGLSFAIVGLPVDLPGLGATPRDLRPRIAFSQTKL